MKKIIRIHLKEKKDYKNKYNEKLLSYDLSNYILEELKGINNKQEIKFLISSDFTMEETEKDNIVDMIRNNFGADISEIINLSQKQRIPNYLILTIGIIFVIIHSFLNIKLLSQFMLIFGWVLLGDAICSLLHNEVTNKHKISRRKQIVNAKVIFEENNNEK